MGQQVLTVEITGYPEAFFIFFGLMSGRQSGVWKYKPLCFRYLYNVAAGEYFAAKAPLGS